MARYLLEGLVINMFIIRRFVGPWYLLLAISSRCYRVLFLGVNASITTGRPLMDNQTQSHYTRSRAQIPDARINHLENLHQ